MADITLSADEATAVITDAQKDKLGEGPIYPGPMPDSDDMRVEVATELVGYAIDAYVNDHMRGEEVTGVLQAAGVAIAEDGTVSRLNGSGPLPDEPEAEVGTEAPEENPTTAEAVENVTLVAPDGSTEIEVPEGAAAPLLAQGFTRKQEEPDPEPAEETPTELTVLIGGTEATLPYEQANALLASGAATPVEQPAEEPSVEQDPVSEEDEPTTDEVPEDPYAGQELEEPWEGYDADKDVAIRQKMEDFDDEQVAYVKAYEGRNKKRKRILNFEKGKTQYKTPALAQAEVQPAEGDPQELEAAQEAEEAAARDTAGEPEEHEATISLEGEEKSGTITATVDPGWEQQVADHVVPILTAQDERALALAEVQKSHLPVPNEELSEPPEMPEDIAAIPDGELWSLHSKFNACLALANWKLGLATIDERAFKHIADSKVREVRNALDPINPATGKHKGQEALDKEAEGSEEVQVWRDKQHQADIRAVPLRKLVEIYSSYVEVLSRQWTFRSREYESSGGLSRRSSD